MSSSNQTKEEISLALETFPLTCQVSITIARVAGPWSLEEEMFLQFQFSGISGNRDVISLGRYQ